MFVLRQVVEEHLPAGMAVSPREGVLPSRGQTVLQIHYSPEQVSRLDARVEVSWTSGSKGLLRRGGEELSLGLLQISLRNMKSVQLRVVGTVEPPNIDMSVVRRLL